MDGEWTTVRLGDVADVNWGDTSVTKDSYRPTGFTAFSASGPDGFRPTYDHEGFGVVLSAIGASCGATWLARGKWSCIKNTIRFWSRRPEYDTRFLFWATRGQSFWPRRGSAQPFISQGDARAVTLQVPPLREQQRIAELLGALDEKIELNRRVTETLEATARALFRSWFVDFDPTRTKAEGRPNALPSTLAALFPDSFGANGLPAGWMLSTVGGLFDVIGGNTPPTSAAENWGGPHQWATPKDLSGLDYPVLLKTEREITEVGLASCTSGLLPPGSLLLSSRAPIGYMAFASQPVAVNQGFAGFLRRDVSTAYAWAWCSEHMNMIRGNAGGSTFPEISKAVLRALPMLRPTEAVLAAFDQALDPIITRLIAAAEQSRALAILRDTLFPKLISGELRIRNVEEAIAAA